MVSKLPSTLCRSPFEPRFGGNNCSSPITAGYFRSSTASSGVSGTYRIFPPFSLERTAISPSLYAKVTPGQSKDFSAGLDVIAGDHWNFGNLLGRDEENVNITLLRPTSASRRTDKNNGVISIREL